MKQNLNRTKASKHVDQSFHGKEVIKRRQNCLEISQLYSFMTFCARGFFYIMTKNLINFFRFASARIFASSQEEKNFGKADRNRPECGFIKVKFNCSQHIKISGRHVSVTLQYHTARVIIYERQVKR